MNYKRIIIFTCAFVAVVLIPVLTGILYGFDWEVYSWWILCGALGTAIGIDQLVIRNRK